MTQREIEDLIIRLLADERGCEPAEVRADLESLGMELPVDSVLAAAVLAEVEARCAVSLPATAERAESLRSVTAFARAILELMQASADEAAGTGA